MTSKTEFQAFTHLKILVGEWKVEISSMSFSTDPNEKVQGRVTFEWLAPNPFIIQHSDFPNTEFPTSHSVIGYDETSKAYAMLYSDSRGVSRIYQMSLDKKSWKLWRKSAKFSQRFTGLFAKGGDQIKAQWEKSLDGSTWEDDFSLVYTRIH